MEIVKSLDAHEPPRDIVLTIGSFDGIHRGHQHLLSRIVQRAREADRLSVVLTFHPHPEAIVHPEKQPQYLSSPPERARIIADLGVDILYLVPFSQELAETPARELLTILHDRLRMRELWVGRDFAMGRDREGDISTLRNLSTQIGYRLRIVKPFCEGGEPVSSTRIRGLLSEGRVEDAARLLGRFYRIPGRVVQGAQRGRNLGFRTANLQVDAQRALPQRGVYAAWANLTDGRQKSVVNVGTRPTFDEQDLLIEAHLLNYAGDLYGEQICIEFVQRLRSERQFADAGALTAQIQRDIAVAQEILVEREKKTPQV